MALPRSDADFASATRASYDTLAVDYAAHFADGLADLPVERSMLRLFASVVDGPVLNIGCGTGIEARELDALGVQTIGLDLSPGMLAVARAASPALPLMAGSMLDLPVADGAAGAVLAWYSTIHVPDDRLPVALAEFARVLRPGGQALLAFQSGAEPRHMSSAFGHDIELVFHRREPEHMADLLAAAGLPVWSRTVRVPQKDEPASQAFLFASKPR